MLELELHRKLAATPHPPTDLVWRLELCEAACPGGEEAVAAEVIELYQNRNHGVIGRLHRKVVQVAARRVAKSRRSPPDFEPRLPNKKRVEPPNRLVAAQPYRAERLKPGP
jgi:hypothetical protein